MLNLPVVFIKSTKVRLQGEKVKVRSKSNLQSNLSSTSGPSSTDVGPQFKTVLSLRSNNEKQVDPGLTQVELRLTQVEPKGFDFYC
jgi:hypothetical protein